MILVIILTHSNLAFKHQIGKHLNIRSCAGPLLKARRRNLTSTLTPSHAAFIGQKWSYQLHKKKNDHLNLNIFKL